MVRSTLIVGGIEMPLLNSVPIPITYSIEDARNPDQTNVDYSYSVELPSSRDLDTFFEFIGDPAISLTSFNPNLGTDVIYRLNETESFIGTLQLVKVITNRSTGETTYSCNFIGKKIDLFYKLGDKLLTGNTNPIDDLDFSKYNHQLTVSNVTDSWTNTNVVNGTSTPVSAGQGYRYALIDYGYTGSGDNGGDGYKFHVQHLRPLLFYREVLEQIFTAAGKTWTSSFLDSAFFKSLVMSSNQAIQITSFAASHRQSYIGITSQTITHGLTLNVSAKWESADNTDVIAFDDSTTPPFSDLGNLFDIASSHILVVPVDGDFTISVNAQPRIRLTSTGTTGTGPATHYSVDYTVKLKIQQLSLTSLWIDVATQTITSSGAAAIGSYFTVPISNSFSFFSTAGDQYRAAIEIILTNGELIDSGGTFILNGTTTSECLITTNLVNTENTFAFNLQSLNINEGDDLGMNQCLPVNFKKKDFFKSILQAFNLYVYLDKANSNNYIIEPEIGFFSSDFIDYTSKLDISKEIETLVMGELDAKKYSFDMKDDVDYFNSRYANNWKKNYGYNEINVENQFLVNQNSLQISFSPTPLVGGTTIINSKLIIPKIYKFDNSTIDNITSNIRMLYWGGVINGEWYLLSSSGTSIQTAYPYAGSLDNPFNPTFDLNFGVPYEVYIKTYPAYVWETSNLTSVYWQPFINRISNKNSRIVRAYFKLDEIDIKLFDFRILIMLEGIKYRVNKIENFDLTSNNTTLIELLKLT